MVEQEANDFLQLPCISSTCNDTPEADGTYGKHDCLSWRTTGCGCCSTEIHFQDYVTVRDIDSAIAKMQEMKRAIDKRISEFRKYRGKVR